MTVKLLFTRVILSILLILFLPLASIATSSSGDLILLPMAIYVDQSKAFLHQGMRSMIQSRLIGQGINIIDDKKVEALLNEDEKKGNISEERAGELARLLKADYALFGSITSVGAAYSLDLNLLDMTEGGSGLTKISEVVEEDALIFKLSDVAYSIAAVMRGEEYQPEVRFAKSSVSPRPAPSAGLQKKSTQSISNFSVVAFDVADLDGDGINEWVVVGQQSLRIYSKERGSYVLKTNIEPPGAETYLKVSVGDIDMNGRPEIYLVSLYGTIRTTVLEWSGAFKELFKINGHLFVTRDPLTDKPLLLFQESSDDEPFFRSIYTMQYENNGNLNKVTRLKQLDKAQLYTVMISDLNGDGNLEYIGLDNSVDALRIWDDKGEELWESPDKMGGSNSIIAKEDIDTMLSPDSSVTLNSRLVRMDIDRDGKDEILVIKNIADLDLIESKVYKKGNVVAFKPEGTRLTQVWTSPTIDECIMDIQTDGQELFLVTKPGKRSMISKGSSRVITFE